MKTLYLLRHAKAEPGGRDVADPDRRLSQRGQDACRFMGGYMKEKRYAPSVVLSSPSARTRETLLAVGNAAGIHATERFEPGLYLAGSDELLRAVQGVDDRFDSAMLVGHNPGMHHIALLLSQAKRTRLREALELKYPTCTLAVLEFRITSWKDVAPGEGKLADFRTPGDLEE